MWSWFTFFLLVHVLTAIAAFGPTYAFPLIASFARRDPRNARLTMEIVHTIETKVTLPAAVAMPFFGLALIYLGHWNLWRSEWLIIAIVLYVIAFFFSAFVQTPRMGRMLDLLHRMSAPPEVLAQEGGMAPVSGAGGPPPEVATVARQLDLGGKLLTVLLTAIIVLMVWKPGA